MANRAVDLIITYRVVKLLATPFEKQEAFKYGIIDKDGNVLKKFRKLKREKERKAYTMLHRFVFNALQYDLSTLYSSKVIAASTPKTFCNTII